MLDSALGGLRWADAVDVALVSALLYALIRWARRSEGALVAVGLAIAGAAWLAVDAAELRMTTWLFHGVFALFAVICAVLFQEELRRGFESIAAWALGRRQDARPKLDTADILVEALASLAERRIGALVLIPGLQPLRRHLRGGTALDGELSLPLLQSLFDPHSDGHDGAAVVHNRRVTQFGVHLPLSSDHEKLGGRGTRHAAALGLAERTDALCLVVSEERGTISVARDGALVELRHAPELHAHIDRFFRQTLPLARRRPTWARALLEHRTEKAAAVGASLALWALFVSGPQEVGLRVEVPIELVNVPRDARVGTVEPARVDAVVRGPRWALLWMGQPRLRIDASDAVRGANRFVVSPDHLQLPASVAAEPFDPVRVAVRMELPHVGSE